MIEFCWAVARRREDARLVEAPAVVASRHCDTQGTLLELLFHLGHSGNVSDAVHDGFGVDHFSALISAFMAISGLVRVIGIG